MPKTRQMPPHGGTVYPWKRWMDGKVHTVRKGKHFTTTPAIFRRFLFVKAKNAGMSVTTRIIGNTVTFQFQAAK